MAERQVTADLVRDALSFISPDLDNDDWARVGMSIKSEFSDDVGLTLFDDWSSRGVAYKASEISTRWRSFKAGGGVTIGTLFGMAKDGGFRFPAADQAVPVPDAAALAREAERKAKQQAAQEAEYRARADKAARDARSMWADADRAPGKVCGSTYLDRKGVSWHGVRWLEDGTVLVPMIDAAGDIQNLQRIAPTKPADGGSDKRFLPGGRKTGLMHVIGQLVSVDERPLLFAEGYATAASLYEATGYPVVVCFDAGNLVHVAKVMRERFPDRVFVVCGDDDQATLVKIGKNPGRDKAASAARAVKSGPVVVAFPSGLMPDESDFNDQAKANGLESVQAVIAKALGSLVRVRPVEDEAAANSDSDVEPPWVTDGEPSSPPPSPGEAGALPEGEGAPEAGSRKRGKGGGKSLIPESGLSIDDAVKRFSLIYGSDTAWDAQQQMIVKIQPMRLAFGREVVNAWLAWPTRRMVMPTDLVFEPGAKVPDHQINMFTGLEVIPTPCEAADVAPMINLLRHLCAESSDLADEVDEIVHWILCWQAYPLQHLGAKMQTACVFHGAQGTGKNLYWDIWRDLFGMFGITVGQVELEDKFNSWLSRKLAIIGDEVVSKQEMYHNKNRLKMVVTQEAKFPIRGMMQETRWESNHANVVFLSNESQPLVLEERDRRYMVVYTPLEADPSLYEAVREFKANGGAAKWLHYLLTYQLGDFGPHTKPSMTKAKADLIELGWRPPERFAHEWLSSLVALPVRVCSAEQLYRAFRRWCDQQGERWPPSQALFTSAVKRWCKERAGRADGGTRAAPALAYKDGIALKDATGARKTVRCWVPAGCVAMGGVSEGEWAHSSVVAFEHELGSFCRRPGAETDGGQ